MFRSAFFALLAAGLASAQKNSDIQCTDDVRQCPDGSYVSRDRLNNCQFKPCGEFGGVGQVSNKPTRCCPAETEPGANGNPICFEGHQCCPDGTWTCSIGDGKTFYCGGQLIQSGFGETCPRTEPTCTNCDGTKIAGPLVLCFADPCSIGDNGGCPVGSTCTSNYCGGCNACCSKPQIACTADVKTCPDGSFVSRDPNSGCAFRECPPAPELGDIGEPCTGCANVLCPCQLCRDGSQGGCCGCFVDTDDKGSKFCNAIRPECPESKTNPCGSGVRRCRDGSTVTRDPNNYCRYPRCPKN